MTKEEYQSEQKKIDEEYNLNRNNLCKRYALENNPYKVGDVIEYNNRIIRITHFRFYLDYTNPRLIYVGAKLKKDLTPFKSGEGDTIYQQEDIKLLES